MMKMKMDIFWACPKLFYIRKLVVSEIEPGSSGFWEPLTTLAIDPHLQAPGQECSMHFILQLYCPWEI